MSKRKEIKKQVEHSEESEEESGVDQDQYENDSFLADDDEEEDYEETRNVVNPDVNDVIMEDLVDSDIEVGEDPVKKKLKKKHKIKHEYGSEEEVENEYNDQVEEKVEAEEEEDFQFIEGENHQEIRKGQSRDNIPRAHQLSEIFGGVPEEEEEVEENDENNQVQEAKRVFGDDELEEVYETNEDKVIAKKDIPERMQKAYKDEQLKVLNQGVKIEAEWIREKLKSYKQISNSHQEKLLSKIERVLEFHKKDYFDIPFIAYYRRLFFEPELSQYDIWKIFEYDKQYLEFVQYKENVRNIFHSISHLLDDKHFSFLEQSYIDKAITMKELLDLEAYISFLKDLNYDDEVVKSLSLKKPSKKSFVHKIAESQLLEFTKSFTISPYELSMNLDMLNKGKSIIFTPKDPEKGPASVAYKYLNDQYNLEIVVLTTVCRFIAFGLSSYPCLRGYIREHFMQFAILTTTPTDEGKKELEAIHPSFRVKRIIRKPINSFSDDLYLDIIENEKKKLITVKIEIEESYLIELSEKLTRAYIKPEKKIEDETAKNTKEWNVLRQEAIRVMYTEFIIPELIKEAHSDLLEKAQTYVVKASAEAFNKILITGPYKKSLSNDHDDDEVIDRLRMPDDTPKVMSFVYDSSARVTYCVVLDEFGEILDITEFSHLCQRSVNYLKDEERSAFERDKAELKSLKEMHKVDLVVIGANDLNCRFLKDQITEVFEENNRHSSRNSFWITYGDLTISKIFAACPFAEKYLKDYNFSIRTAISLGRFKQNPLVETLLLWHEDINKNFALSLNLSPFQKLVNQAKLSEALEEEAIKVSSTIGIDINKIYEHPHLQSTLRFIAGFGPRKAKYLIEKLLEISGLKMRSQLLFYHILDKNIYMNCAGFLKVKTKEKDRMKSNPLDLTRIHPETYSIAVKFAQNCADDSSKEKKSIDKCVEEMMRDPKKLSCLDLSEHISKMEESGKGSNIRLIFNFIISEINNPFKDQRAPHKDLTANEIFYLFINETPQSFDRGHIVLARVIKVEDQHVKCKLDNDLEATVWIRDIFDLKENENPDPQKMREKFVEGLIFPARIKSIKTINEKSFKVDLTCKPSEIEKHKNFVQIKLLDQNFKIIESEDYINRKYIQENKEEVRRYQPRSIKNPFFKNMNFLNAIEYLSDKDFGEYIFRPSSKGPNFLTLTFKFYHHTYTHIQIVEEDKPAGASIGSKLYINGVLYFSLQEIVDRYIKPCEKVVRDVINNRKFKHCESVNELELFLKGDRDKDSRTIHYYFTILREYPQYVVLGYIPRSNNIVKEYIKVKPNGLHYHNESFDNLENLINWFKKNFGTDEYKTFVKRSKPPNVELANRNIENQAKETKNEWESTEEGWRQPKSPSSNLGDRIKRDQNWENSSVSNYSRSDGRFDRKGDRKPISCYNCNEVGHIAAKCPNGKKNEDDRGKRYVGSKRNRSPSDDYRSRNVDRDERKSVPRDFRNERRDEKTGGRNSNNSWDQPQTLPPKQNVNDDDDWGLSNNHESHSNHNNRPSNVNPSVVQQYQSRQDDEDDWGLNPNQNVPKYNNQQAHSRNKTEDDDDDWGLSKPQEDFNQRNNNNQEYDRSNNYRNEGRSSRGDRGGRGGRGGFRGGSRSCFNCHEEGHFAHSCPKGRN